MQLSPLSEALKPYKETIEILESVRKHFNAEGILILTIDKDGHIHRHSNLCAHEELELAVHLKEINEEEAHDLLNETSQ